MSITKIGVKVLLMVVIGYFILSIAWLTPAFANLDCRIADLISKGLHNDNEEFWQEFSKLNQKNPKAVEEFLKKYGSNTQETGGPVKKVALPTQKNEISFHRTAAHNLPKLPPKIKNAADEALSILTDKGPRGFLENQGSWQYKELQGQKNIFTVRLNGEYRMAFTVEGDNEFRILEIAKSTKGVGH